MSRFLVNDCYSDTKLEPWYLLDNIHKDSFYSVIELRSTVSCVSFFSGRNVNQGFV